MWHASGMDLSTWIAEEKLSNAAAARLIGVGEGTVHNICSGRRKPSGKLAAKIETVTGGKVPMKNFFVE